MYFLIHFYMDAELRPEQHVSEVREFFRISIRNALLMASGLAAGLAEKNLIGVSLSDKIQTRILLQIFENMKVGEEATIRGICGKVIVGYMPSSCSYYAISTDEVIKLPEPVVVKKVLLPDGPDSSMLRPFFVVEVPNSKPYAIEAVYAVVSGTIIKFKTK